jgi:hypothetical protein
VFLLSAYTAERPGPDGLPRGFLAKAITFISASGTIHAFEVAVDPTCIVAARTRFRFQKSRTIPFRGG